MSTLATALAGALTAVGVGSVSLARSWPQPRRGRHRATRQAGKEFVPLDELLRPIEALDQFEAHCPIEDRPTLQVRLRLGGALCTECRNPGGA